MPRVTILGAGSIGCYLGGRLIEGGGNVRLIGRDRFKDAIAENGLRLSGYDRPVVTIRDVDFRTELESLTGSDVVALCVKSQDTEAAAEAIRSYAPDAWIVSFQNGVGNLALLERLLPGQTVSASVVPFNVTSPDAGLFHQGTAGDLLIGPVAPPALLGALTDSRTGVRLVENIDGHLWAKLLVNLNNALNALSGGPLRDGLVQRDYRRVLAAMIAEGLTVANAEDVNVATFNGRSPDKMLRILSYPDWLYRIIMDRVVRIDRTARSSMLDDLDLGRASELGYLQGEIIRRAENLGIYVPVNRCVTQAVEQAFSQGTSPRLTGHQMAERFL